MTMPALDRAQGDGFRRQVTFRIGPEDAPLLDAAARVHGGIQSGIVAALRAYAAQRLQAAVPPDAREEPRPESEASARPPKEEPPRATARKTPAPVALPEDDWVELNISEAAPILGLSASTLREKIKAGRHPGRVGETGFYLAELSRAQLRDSGVRLSPRGAGEVLGLKAGTIKSRCKAGRYPNARHDGLAWAIPVSDLL